MGDTRRKVKSEGRADENVGRMNELDLCLFQLKIAHSVKDVSFALKLDPEKFFYVLQHTDEGRYYHTFEIPKKNGGKRAIAKPVRGLALAQDRLAPLLHHVYNPGPHVKAFVTGSSFVSNASYHKGQRWILNIDLSDFFPSINFPRVRGLFLSKLFGFNPSVSTILARICTFQGSLPQGASTSPVLANIIANSLDRKLLEIARSEKIKYSRYSDDITFSSSKKSIPKCLVKSFHDHEDGREVILGNDLQNAVRVAGFSLNEQKTRLMMPNNRQEVTGLTVNERVNVRRSDINRLRMVIHSAKKVGFEEASKVWLPDGTSNLREHILGWLAHIKQVRGASDPVLAKLCLQAHNAGLTKVGWIEELADMSKDFDVFLSHASEDKDRVRKLHDALTAGGVKVFFDESSIKWGDSIVEKVNHGLLKSRFFIPFLTTTFSKKGWTNKELNSSISMNISRKGRILPIKSEEFEIGDKYPILNETLYKTWPKSSVDEAAFIQEVVDSIIKMIEEDKAAPSV